MKWKGFKYLKILYVNKKVSYSFNNFKFILPVNFDEISGCS